MDFRALGGDKLNLNIERLIVECIIRCKTLGTRAEQQCLLDIKRKIFIERPTQCIVLFCFVFLNFAVGLPLHCIG